MDYYYYANQVYQLSYAKPLLTTLGGTVIVKRFRKIPKFKIYLEKIKEIGLKETPSIDVIARDTTSLHDIHGVLISNANSFLKCDKSKCRMIFVYHGSGDKKYGGDPKRLLEYDYHFITGPKNLYKLQDVGIHLPEKKLLKVGNMRFDEYLEMADQKDALLEKFGIKDKKRKNILYAPTWKWGNGTLKTYGKLLCRLLSEEFNLIIRPHYYDKNYALYLKSWVKLKKLEHVYFSNTSNIFVRDVMHDFVISDLLITDTSSIMYEYLITRKPIVIAKTDYDDLHNMPEEMYLPAHVDHFRKGMDIISIIWKNLENKDNYEKYNTLLFNCFYFNDGKSTRRALDYIARIQKEIE